MKLRTLARTIAYSADTKQILLVKNKNANFWYAPGGGWEPEHETIQECAVRETYEETGLRVKLERLLYVQEFHESENTIFFETFWLASLSGNKALDTTHIDLDPEGEVEAAQWFAKDELQSLKVFPKRLKDTFWETVDTLQNTEDPFIGVS